ncbi:MAG: phospholipase D/Transphosphatidylase [Bacteroidetes bacterium]|nr:phospholipase D/Transphosphatidylase [Bacteroidota bacterium]
MIKVIGIVLIVLYIYTIISTISVLLLENRNPTKSFSWILVLVFLPVIGLLLYILIGQDYRKRKIISRKSIQRIADRPVASIDLNKLSTTHRDQHFIKLTNLLKKNSESDGYAWNKIDVYSRGEDIFQSMFDAIKNAKNHIHIEFFIFEDDKLSNELRELLIQKSKEGVRVRMIYDYVGSINLSTKYLLSLRCAGVYVRPFLPLRLRMRRSKINYRNHRKLVVVDGKIGFTGGINIADRYRYGSKLGEWRDTVVRIEGAGVHGIQKLFLIDWYFVERKLITSAKYFPEPEKFQENLIQFISSGPDTDWKAIMQGIASSIMSAEKYVYIHTPYFMPNDLMAGCIQMAALSGTEIRLMIPEKSDAPLSDLSSSSYLGEMMEAGVRIFIYKKGFLHSKAIVMDDRLSIIGSTNMDDRSFDQNFEANAFIYDTDTALRLKELFMEDLEKCEELTYEVWNNRKHRQKLKESFARLFSPLM